MKFLKFMALAIMVGVTGCATILKEDTQKVNISTSTGEQTTVTINGESHTVPGVVSVKRSKEDLVIQAGGNCTENTVATPSVEPVFWVNILSGGAFGSTTDYASEKMWKYQDNISVSCKQ